LTNKNILASKFLTDLRGINQYHFDKHSRMYSENPPNFNGQIDNQEGNIVVASGKAVVDYIAKTLFDYNLGIENMVAFGVAGWGISHPKRKIEKNTVEGTASSSFQAIRGLGDLMKNSMLDELRRQSTILDSIFDKSHIAKRKELKSMENPCRGSCDYALATWSEPEQEILKESRSPGCYQDQMERHAVDRVRSLRKEIVWIEK
jgi:hypothetical protein